MAFTEFYIQGTGVNSNAGSTNADAASVTETNGSWDITADTFIASANTPFSGVAVGEWASVYIDGAASAVYVAQVTALHAAGLGVVLSTTAKYGTKPAASATARSCKIGGAWASLAVVTSLFASVAVPFATRVNVKAGTYANTTTARTFGSAGLTTGPLWWRGYTTAIGDMDAVETVARVDGTDIPLFTWTTATCTLSGARQLFSNISFRAAVTNVAVNVTGANVTLVRCRIENTQAVAGSQGLQVTGAGVVLAHCFMKSTVQAANTLTQGGAGLRLLGCVVIGGLVGIEMAGGASSVFAHCVVRDVAGAGISFVSALAGHFSIVNCTFSACTNSGIYLTTLPTTLLVAGCIFDSNTGYGINNNSGANTTTILRYANSFFGNTSGQETGMGDVPVFFDQTEVASALTGATDMALVATALAVATGLPGLFENETYASFLDIGAVQREAAGGGGGSIAHSLIAGGA